MDAAVRKVICEWDPYGFFKMGCPYEEMDSEIHAIVKQVDRIHSPHDAADVISRVFFSSFGGLEFPLDEYKVVGGKLFLAINAIR